MATLPLDRLVRKEVSLGLIREFEPPQDHIGLRQFAPLQGVQSDDQIFNYTRGLTAGLAPARAEDAESELAGKDESIGYGRASVIDWALKDHYDPSDVSRFREGLILGGMAGATNFPLVIGNMNEEFQAKLARDTARRRRMLDNRLEWLIMQAMDTGKITYNDGKIQFVVDYGRPTAQQDFLPPSTGNRFWSDPLSDPIEDILTTQADAKDNYGVTLNRALISTKIWRSLRRNQKFVDAITGANPLYRVTGWGDEAAANFVAQQTNITFQIYDSVYRTRPLRSNTTTNNRFTRDNIMLLLPAEQDVAALDDTIGFGATLTSPHPEGNWTSGFYEWERDTGPDPWGFDRGNGIKAFPVMPHMELSYAMRVLA
jgi:hypothetical protein